MVEIFYGEHQDQADLAGKSVAEAREQYQAVFDIPDRAKASLNGKQLKKKLEPETKLCEGDELSFEVKKGSKTPLLAGALLLALAITGGLFAYTYLTASTHIGAVADSDFATVEPKDEIEFTTRVFGHYRGNIPTGNLFEITPDADYTGDLNVKIYLTNADELTYAYKHLNMMLSVVDSQGNTMNVDWTEAYKQARDHYGTAGTNFASNESIFNTADTTFDTAEGTYLSGGPIVTFLNAVDTYQKAIKTWQSGIVTYQAETDAFNTTATLYNTSVNSTVASALSPTFNVAHTAFDTAVTNYNIAVTTFNTAVNGYKAGTLTEALFKTAINDYQTAADTFLTATTGKVDVFQAVVTTFLGVLDAYLDSAVITELGHTWQLLTLDNGAVALDLRPSWGVSPFHVTLLGGSFTTHGRSPIDWNTSYSVEPLLYCEVTQR